MTMTSWSLAVMGLGDDDQWAAVTVQPGDGGQHAEMVVRLKAAGLKKLTRREWDGALWPVSKCSVTVEGGHFTQIHTGRSRFLCTEPMPVSPLWVAAAGRGRAVLAVVPPGTWPDSEPDGEKGVEARARLIDAAVDSRFLIGGLAEVRDTPEPYGRRW
jgi:hypothetical protein